MDRVHINVEHKAGLVKCLVVGCSFNEWRRGSSPPQLFDTWLFHEDTSTTWTSGPPHQHIRLDMNRHPITVIY
jgi:hypothetical protein